MAALTALPIVFVTLTSFILLAVAIMCLPMFLAIPLILAIPTLILWRLRKRTAAEGDDVSLDRILRFVAEAFWPGVALVALTELGLMIVFALLFLRDSLTAAAQQMQNGDTNVTIAKDTGYYAFIFCMAFIVAATTEEAAKLIMVRCSCCSNQCCAQSPEEKNKPYVTLTLFLAVSAGFSTAENVLYTYTACSGSAASLGMTLLSAVVRVALSLPVHLVCACFTALLMSKRDLQRAQGHSVLAMPFVLLPAILIHGTFDFQAMLIENEFVGVFLGYVILAIALAVWWRLWSGMLRLREETGAAHVALPEMSTPVEGGSGNNVEMGVVTRDATVVDVAGHRGANAV